MAMAKRRFLLVLATALLVFLGNSCSTVMSKSAAEWEKAMDKELEELTNKEHEEDDNNVPPPDSQAQMIMVEIEKNLPGWKRGNLVASAQTWQEVLSTGGVLTTVFDISDTELAVTMRDDKQAQTAIDFLVKQENVSKVVYKYENYFPDGSKEKQTMNVGIEELEKMGMKMNALGGDVENLVNKAKEAKEKHRRSRRRRRRKGKGDKKGKAKQEL
jgi:hypothetical protein